MRRSSLAWVFGVAAVGCGPDVAPMADSGQGASSGDPATTTLGSPGVTGSSTSTAATSAADDTAGSTSTGVDFVDPSAGGGCEATGTGGGAPSVECSLWAQDCCPGDKCTAWANDGGTAPNATRCVPIDPNGGAPGSPCTVEGNPASGIDDCDAQSYCVAFSSPGLDGICVGFCEGEPDAPICRAGTECFIANEGALIWCLDICDPLAADCPEFWSCQISDGTPLCLPAAPDKAAEPGDPCEFETVCGLEDHCIAADSFPGCQGPGCCTPYCDVNDPGSDATCAALDPALACVPLYAPGEAPVGLDHLGVCSLS